MPKSSRTYSTTMKGIVLAGGLGTRLLPITKYLSKQSLPVYDKPMIYYPISTLALAGIKQILIISTPDHIEFYKKILGNGRQFGMEFEYTAQAEPKGIAQAFEIGEDFIGNDTCALILGDNLFHGPAFGSDALKQFTSMKKGAKIFGYHVSNPEDYGVIEVTSDMKVINLIEKPKSFKGNLAIPGLYFFDSQVVQISKSIIPSKRNELEIIDVLKEYLMKNELTYEVLSRGNAWLDTGTFEGLHTASEYVRIIEQRQGYKIGCIEEVAWRNNWINKENLLQISKEYQNSSYGKYLEELALQQNQK